MSKYDSSKIEKKWQKYWAKEKMHEAKDGTGKTNYMLLTEFPYPSGNLHIGHWYAFALPDILARYLRMNGKNVLYPIGFDAFGLPAENAAIQRNINPRDWTEQNIKFMTQQLESMGTTFDWAREVRTIDPEYYKWTQWMFLKFFEKGLAYRAKTAANWCPKDKTVLANEQVVDGCCERCGTVVEKKEIEQWMFKITNYADRLIDDLDKLDWPNATKLAQKNWIARSEGALIKFGEIEVFTTRPDTIYGVTFIAVSPARAKSLKISEAAQKYVQDNEAKTTQDFKDLKEKTGVYAGLEVEHPLTGEKIPVWVSNYVLSDVGTGALMGVPAYDERDLEFATKFKIPVKEIKLEDTKAMIALVEDKRVGRAHKTYRLHDWLLSRQRYWGVPIPMIKCATCGYQAVPEKDLPVELPKLDDFLPADDGRSPLAKATKWVKAKCPKCGKDAERETDTMDTFVDSSWYFLRYADPNNKKEFAAKDKTQAWLPVPMYIGGAEHNTMHLLYSRFFTKALHDLGYVEFDEPFLARRNHGIILGPDNQKMSKSKGNVVDPDIEVAKYGADTVRMYLAFMGPYEQGGPWNPGAINGVHRFLNRIWDFFDGKGAKVKSDESARLDYAFSNAIKKIGEDIQNQRFNTGVSELMKLLNEIESYKLETENYKLFCKLLAPYAPHLAEELWQEVLKNKNSVHLESWPTYDQASLSGREVGVVVQINGRMRDTVHVAPDISEGDLKQMVFIRAKVKPHLDGKSLEKVIYVPGKIINLVVK